MAIGSSPLFICFYFLLKVSGDCDLLVIYHLFTWFTWLSFVRKKETGWVRNCPILPLSLDGGCSALAQTCQYDQPF